MLRNFSITTDCKTVIPVNNSDDGKLPHNSTRHPTEKACSLAINE